MIFQKASKGETPKLAEAFPAIFDLISDNPRSALGFFEDARTKEVLFLNRYGHEEEKFCAFFIALICQHEFPDFAEKLMLPEIRESYQTASYVDWMNANSNNSTKDKNLESFHDLLINRLNIEPDSARSNRLKKLTEALVDRASGSDLDWIISGYDKLLELASEERAVLLEVWNVQAGNEPISHMIARRLPGLPFCDEERCAEQLIELEFEEIKKKTQEAAKARALNRRELLKTALAKLEKLHKHLLFAKAESLSADLAPFDEKLFGSWLEYINDIPLDSLESEQDLAQQLHKERTDFHIELAKRFDVFRCWNFAVGEIDRILRLGAYRAPQAEANTHRQLLKKVLYQRVTEEFKKSFRSGEIWQHFPVGFPTAWGLGQLYSPKVWLFTDDEDWKSDLHAFSSEANDDQILAETCARIASAIFLSPLNDPNLSVEDNLYRWRNIKGLAKEFPEYLAFFWNAAMSLEPGNRERLELMEYRRKATEAQAECPEALDLINNHFLVQTIRDSDS